MVHGFSELHQRRSYVTCLLLVSRILRLGENLPQNGMDEIRVNVFFVQRGADRELDARNYAFPSLIRRPRTGQLFLRSSCRTSYRCLS